MRNDSLYPGSLPFAAARTPPTAKRYRPLVFGRSDGLARGSLGSDSLQVVVLSPAQEAGVGESDDSSFHRPSRPVS